MAITTLEKLLKLIEIVPTESRFFLDTTISSVETFDTEEIQFELKRGNRRLAAFCSQYVEGKLVGEGGYERRSFKPAYIKEKTPLGVSNSFKRRAGEQLAVGSMTPEQRQAARLTDSLEDKKNAIRRRMEWMAAQAMVTGKLTIEGEGYPLYQIDYRRNAALQPTPFANNKKWGAEGVSIISDIEKYDLLTLKTGGSPVDMHVTRTAVWEVMKQDEKFLKILDNRNIKGVEADFGARFDTKKVKVVATIGGVPIILYEDWYETYANDGSMLEQIPFIPDGYFLGYSKAVDGYEMYGAIYDKKAGLKPHQYFPKTWEIEDPSAEIVMVQSAPIVAYLQQDNSYSIKVI